MRYFVLLITMLSLAGCEHKVPAYAGESGEMSVWINVYGDTTADIGSYLNYENGKLVPTLSWYAKRDSADIIQDLRVWLEGFPQDTLLFIQGEFPGAIKKGYEGLCYADVREEMMNDADSLTTEQLSIQAQTDYVVAAEDLPETLQLNYIVTTLSGTSSGSVIFKKTEKTIVETMRFH